MITPEAWTPVIIYIYIYIYNFCKFATEQMSIGVVCVAYFQEKEKEKRIFSILLTYALLHTFIVLFSDKKKNIIIIIF